MPSPNIMAATLANRGVNPLTGKLNDAAEMDRNLGTLVPEEDFSTGELVRGAIPARCGERR